MKEINEIGAAIWESEQRFVSEKILRDYFSPLPFTMMNYVCYSNDIMFGMKNNSKNIITISRPLPKGSVGLDLEKPLHDDGNACLCPGIWTNIKEDKNNTVDLFFIHKNFNLKLRASEGRIALFLGWIPHKTKVVGEKKQSSDLRIHHTAYMKPEHEFISSYLLNNPEHCYLTEDIIKFQ